MGFLTAEFRDEKPLTLCGARDQCWRRSKIVDCWHVTLTSDQLASHTHDVVTATDLVITISDSPDPVTAGDELTYTITVTNQRPSPAQNVVVTDILPAGVTFVSTTGCAEDPNGVPTCSLGDIPVGSSAQYTITTAVDIGTEGVATNVVNVASDTLLINTGDDSASEDTNVAPIFDLIVTTADDELDAIPDPDDLSLREAIEIAKRRHMICR